MFTLFGPSDMPPSPQNPAPAPMRRPTIGLALGGGVARGWCHIGVLRALSRAGIEPDVIAGTSIGAVVGGLHLAGHLDDLEEWARGLTKRSMLRYLDILPGGSGLLGGKKLDRLMAEYLGDTTIEALPKPFTAVCSELATGHEIWVRKGPLADGVRASYALPGVFPPFHHEGRWLVDGALVNPVPVSVCRAMGARLVIAVALNHDAFGKGNMAEGTNFKNLDFTGLDFDQPTSPGEDADANGRLSHAFSKLRARATNPQRMAMRQIFGSSPSRPGITTVMLGALNIIMDRLSRSRMAGDPPDVLVTPRCGHISLVDFDKADEAIALGEEAMESVLPYLDEVLTILS